ncbi:MAG: hypothetical protein FWD71_02120 [Oscillospiraceae bacterium]|nr:hypothetical protein [Oscillospiraceae bacterium]
MKKKGKNAMNNQGSAKSMLPLVEIIISIGIFAIAIVLTLQLFLLAKFLGDKTSDTARAIFEIQNIAESIKLLKSDAEIKDYMENDIGNADENGLYNLYYDGGWKRVDSSSGAVFVMKIAMNEDNYAAGDVYNFKLDLYKSDPYPFINDKNVKADKNYKPLLASVNTSNFVVDMAGDAAGTGGGS